MEFTRISRKYVSIPVTATLADNAPATISGVDVALLPKNYKPTADTAWSAADYADDTASILIAGPDADPTGALILAAEADLWIRVADAPEVDAVKVTRLSVPSQVPLPAPAVNYVTTTQLTDALAALPTGGGGGGAVASVNGHTGVVVLGATDVGAQPAGSYVTTADARLTDQRVPTDSSVTNTKVATGAAINADKLADGTTNKVLTATERTKLTGVATGATANSSDATLLARANHTGTQAAATITGLATVATSGAYADLTGTPTLYTDEQVRDVIGAALVAGANITLTVNDPGDTITIAAAGGGGSAGMLSQYVTTLDPRVCAATRTVQTASRGCYVRASGSGTVTSIAVHIGTSSGNICVAVYANTGSGRAARPGTRTATSGSVASPGAGYQEISLGGSVTVNDGDWLYIGADNATVTLRAFTATAAIATSHAEGLACYEAGAFPAPATATATPTWDAAGAFLLMGRP